MAAADVRDFMKLWTQSDQTSERLLKKILAEGLDVIVQRDSDLLAKISVGPTLDGPVYRWMEEVAYPTFVTAQLTHTTGPTVYTLAISGKLFNKNVSTELINQCIRVGTILERESDRVQIKVTSVAGIADGTPFEATVELYGNTTGADDSGAVSWRIISEVWTDYTAAANPRSLTRGFREVGTQIHAETFEIPKTRENTRYEIVNNETEHQMGRLLEKMRRQLAYSVLRSRPKYVSSSYVYGNQAEDSTMCGILMWPEIFYAEHGNANVYKNTSGAEITKTMLDDLVRSMWLEQFSNFNAGDWWIVTHPLQHGFIHDFDISYRRKSSDERNVGFEVDVFDSKIGKSFPILADQYMPPDTLIIVDMSKLSYGYYANDRMERKEIATDGRYRRWLISFQTYGTVMRGGPGTIGMIRGLPQS